MTTLPPVSEPVARLFLFGPMRADDRSGTVDVPSGNAQRLLAYLVLHPRAAHRRESLCDVLWADAPAEQARRALSDTIYRLRSRGADWVRAHADNVSLVDDVWSDVSAFDRLIAGGSTEELAAAIDLYRADLLPAVYDDWAVAHRTARHQSLVAALTTLIAHREQCSEPLDALLLARQLVIVEPFDEAGHQAYLRLLGRLGRYGEARSHYEDLRRMLADEFASEPLDETAAIMQSIADEREVSDARHHDPGTPFVGRVAERAAVLAAVDAALNGRGSIVGIEGPAGIGKSKLLDEVLAGARWRGATSVKASVSGVPEASAVAPLGNALAPLLRGPMLSHVEGLIDPNVRTTLGLLNPAWAAAAAAPAVVDHAEARLAHALRSLGSAIASTGRVVVAIDDMHRATATLWDAVAAFADGFVAVGGLLVLAYRRPDVESSDGWAHLQDWDRAGSAKFVTLLPFDAGEVAELLAGHDADPEQVLALTGGIPFYVTNWSGATAGMGTRDARTLVASRLKSLPSRVRSALDAAAVIGDEVPYRLWIDASQEAPLDLAAIVEALAAERWLTPSEHGYAFTHDIVQTAVYELIDAERRTEIHRRVGDALARHDPGNARAQAFHLDHGGRARQAAAMYAEAGRRARQSLAFRESIDAYARALTLLPRNSDLRLDVALALTEACEVVGDRERQRPLLSVIVDGSRRRGDDTTLLRALIVAGSAASRTDDPAGGERLLAEAMDVATRLGDPLSMALAEYRFADLMGQQGRWPEALATVTSALAHARLASDPTLLGGVLRMRGIVARYTGDPAGSLRWHEEAVAAHRAAGDALEELNSAANLTGAYYELCAWDALLAVTDELLPRAMSYGAPGIIGILLHQGGLAAMALGDPVTARARMIEAREAFASAGRQRLAGLVVNTIGLVAEDEGKLDEALEHYERALATADAIDASTESAYASHDLGALLARVGRADEAVPLLERAISIWERHDNAVALAKSRAHLALAHLTLGAPGEASALADLGLATLRNGFPPGEQAQGWLWTLYRVLTALGRDDQARATLVAADAELDRQAAAIADPERRRQFLERVPLNRAIVDEVAAVEGTVTAGPIVVSVELARADVPLGRPLRPGELVIVDWTVGLPDDDAILDARARRRHRLSRLLAESAAVGAAPTDDALARALGVSRRTILRDMAALADDEGTAPTRRRLRGRGQQVTPG